MNPSLSDPIFEVGNLYDFSNWYSNNALTIFRDGTVRVGDAIKSGSLEVTGNLKVTGTLSAPNLGNLAGNGSIFLNTPTSSNSFTPPTTISGNTFLWWPTNNSLNIGNYATGTSALTPSKDIGSDSVAIGNLAKASKADTIAFGFHTTASGQAGAAIGYYASANGRDSAAFGPYAGAYGDYSIALGEGNAAGMFSVGILGSAGADYSVAIAGYTSSQYGIVLGSNTNMLKNTTVDVWAVPDAANPTLDDPIFEVGNFDMVSTGINNNALTIFRDGTVRVGDALKSGSLEVTGDIAVSGTIRLAAAKGGISMGNFQ
jgi:hypothetical protein